jgi:hypothetical protein
MNPLVAEYKTLAPDSDSLPDHAVDNRRKLEIFPLLEKDIDEPEVAQLLLEVLANPLEFDLARIEAIKLVGIFVTESNSLCGNLRAQLLRIFSDENEDEMLRGCAERYVRGRSWSPQAW